MVRKGAAELSHQPPPHTTLHTTYQGSRDGSDAEHAAQQPEVDGSLLHGDRVCDSDERAGEDPALPRPAMARPTMRAVDVGATPQIKEPSSKRNRAVRKTDFIWKMV